MHCKILLLEDPFFEVPMVQKKLSASGHKVEVYSYDAAVKENLLEEESFDIIVLFSSSKDILARVAFLERQEGSFFKLFCILFDENESIIEAVQNKGFEHILIESQSAYNIYSFIHTGVQNSRMALALQGVYSHMKEASVTFAYSKGLLTIKEVNQPFLDIEESPKSSFVGKTLQEVDSIFNISILEDNIVDVFNTKETLHLPSFFYMKNDQREWVDIMIYSAMDYVTLIASPLSEIKRAHDKAEESKRYLQTILNAQKHIIYITDGKNIINTNNAFLNFFGFNTMYDFLQKHKRVCELFEESEDPHYIGSNKALWMEDVLRAKSTIYKVRIRLKGTISVFYPHVELITINGKRQYVVILTDITELESEKEKLRIVAMTDTLTGAASRFKFNTVIDEYVATAKRYKSDFSVILFDVDHFKKINDTMSHLVGDEVLIELTSLVKHHIRESDILIRWGGEEFVILLNNTNKENAQFASEKLREFIAKHKFSSIENLTCSFGVSTFIENDTVSSLLNRADEAMYQAKRLGRNRTVVL